MAAAEIRLVALESEVQRFGICLGVRTEKNRCS